MYYWPMSGREVCKGLLHAVYANSRRPIHTLYYIHVKLLGPSALKSVLLHNPKHSVDIFNVKRVPSNCFKIGKDRLFNQVLEENRT